jgi:hypothetical protein
MSAELLIVLSEMICPMVCLLSVILCERFSSTGSAYLLEIPS